jgi:Protein of unknown function (DUF2800)
VNYLEAADFDAWVLCAGKPALEELEHIPPSEKRYTNEVIEGAVTALQATGAKVEVLRRIPLDIGVITAERGALEVCDAVLIGEFDSHSVLHVEHPGGESEHKILALAALLKYQLLHNFTETNVGTPDELYVFGAQVTAAAAISLSVRGDATALSHLAPGPYCKTCRAAYHCPALEKEVHSQVFGDLQAPDDPELSPASLRSRLADPEGLPALIAATVAKLPMIEDWCASVRAQDALIRGEPPPKAQPVRKKRKYRKRKKPKPVGALSKSP